MSNNKKKKKSVMGPYSALV